MEAVLNKQTEYDISLLELVFGVRNKDYGAYVLRTSYSKNLTIAMLITVFTFVTLLMLPQFLNKDTGNLGSTKNPDVSNIPIDLQNSPTTEDEILKIPENTIHINVEKIRFVVPIVVYDPLASEESSVPTIEEIDGKVISTITQAGIAGINNLPVETENSNESVIIKESPKEDIVFSFVEEMPSYPGGTDELLTFISVNIKYPEIARRAGVEGKVLIGFVVERDGSISEIKVLKGIGAGCDEEAVRVLGFTGKWIPGKQNGKAVRVNMVIPFVFRLN